MHSVLGPHGEGWQGSGLGTHLWLWHTLPCWQSGSRVHSGPQPVMVSGLGISPGSHRQMGLPGNNNHWQLLSRDKDTQPIILYQMSTFYLATLHTLKVDSADSPRPTR